ncbi:MAG: hypothetical protein IPJ68_02905 [Candidatus Moraniibacteriota bacterium]|nr:MAG: hypothetical protein IPJ68_02905 [Candidatus Moranbacteria bacterium]
MRDRKYKPRRSWSARRLERWAMVATGLILVVVLVGCIVGIIWTLSHDAELRAAEAREAATPY